MDTATHSSLERGLRVLDLLRELDADPMRRTQSLSVQQVAVELGVHKSTASRLLQTLAATGYAVPSTQHRRGYCLGPHLSTVTDLTQTHRALRELAHPFLIKLVERTGECAHLAVAVEASVMVLDDVETTHPLRVVAGKGRSVPLHCTSAGKCLMAFGVAAVPPRLSARTEKTIVDRDVLHHHLRSIAEDGYSLDDEENHLGVRCISAPIFTRVGGVCIGCIGIDGPTVRMTHAVIPSLAQAVGAVARDLTHALSSPSQSTQVDQPA